MIASRIRSLFFLIQSAATLAALCLFASLAAAQDQTATVPETTTPGTGTPQQDVVGATVQTPEPEATQDTTPEPDSASPSVAPDPAQTTSLSEPPQPVQTNSPLDVILTSPSGNLNLQGRVLGFDGTFIRVDSAYGELTLDLNAVTCAGPGCPDPAAFVPLLRFSGDGQITTLVLPALIEAFATENALSFERTAPSDGVVGYALTDSAGVLTQTFQIHTTTTEDGFADLVANEADIAIALRPLTSEEINLGRDAGLGRLDRPGSSITLAFDALAPIVAPGQQVRDLDLTELARVFSGDLTNWSTLGGDDLPITLHLADAASGQVQGLVSLLLSPTDRSLGPVIHHATDADVAVAVATDPGAIGIVSRGNASDAIPLALRGRCGITATLSPDSIKTQDYPLVLPALLYLPMRRLPDASAAFLAWLGTTSAQIVLDRAGVVGTDPGTIPWAMQGDRLKAAIHAAGPEVTLSELQSMLTQLGPLERLTLTFRFDPGSTRLDAISRSNLRVLARAIRDGRFNGHRLVLAGFSDSRGPADGNRQLSDARADTIRRDLLQALGGPLPGQVRLETHAYGEALPVACDDTPIGQHANRRVELWIDPD
jgi:phosphate transport system substrate-binding protein